MKETSKAISRRLGDPLFMRAVKGVGIDIGAGKDPLNANGEFGVDCRVIPFDIENGEAQTINQYFPTGYFDFLYSSHCLEHLKDIKEAFNSWIGVIKPGGYGIIVVPDEDLYEQGFWHSKWAGVGHRHTFTIKKDISWSPVSINVLDFFSVGYCSEIQTLSVRLIDNGYDYSVFDFDQTAGKAEAAIELIFRKKIKV
jgi:SAM-dependent methyltransferase